MTYVAPCQDRRNNPDDWFIGRDGRQYSDDLFLTRAEERLIERSVLRKSGETEEEHDHRCASAITSAISTRKRAAGIRRRQAKQACFSCLLREPCLAKALEEPTPATSGTWGGLYEEELAQTRTVRARRRRRSVNA